MNTQPKTASNFDPKIEMSATQVPLVLAGQQGSMPFNLSDEHRKILVRGTKSGQYRSSLSLTQSLLGDTDRRTEVTDPSPTPWRMICLLKIRSKDGGDYIGTGWIAGPRLIITAGHCLYHEAILGGWADEVQVLPGHIDGVAGEVHQAIRMETSLEWLYKGDENFDIGAIFLAEDISPMHGAFAVGTYPDKFFQDLLVNISGYPFTRYGDIQLHHENRINSVTRTKLYYDVDTEGGQSGSPIWIYEGDDLENPIVVGVHAHGAGSSEVGNSGIRITQQIYQLIAKWKQSKP